ncbi:hypothetical protein KVT40_007470 [Elsinoe batatas]|uniref:Uncharacterized protein n=1 Tax=Elsinoe batatas TaxID=2601811 RepID=A0A8K0PEN5_9PEZI|nr:hypothetical protein KVT40_007470 [Elsinoe batatas]
MTPESNSSTIGNAHPLTHYHTILPWQSLPNRLYRVVITNHSPPNPSPKSPLGNMSLHPPPPAFTTTDEHTGGTTLSSLYGHYYHSPTSTWQSRTGPQHKRTGAVANVMAGNVGVGDRMVGHAAERGGRSPVVVPPRTPRGVASAPVLAKGSDRMGTSPVAVKSTLRSPPTLPPRAPRPLVVRPERATDREPAGLQGAGAGAGGRSQAQAQVYTPSFYRSSLSYGRTTSLLGLTPRPRRDVCEMLELVERTGAGPRELMGKPVLGGVEDNGMWQGRRARPRGVYLPASMSAPVFGSCASGPALVYTASKLASPSTGRSARLPSSTGTRLSPCSPVGAGQAFRTLSTVEMGDEAGLDSTLVEEGEAQRRMTPRK